jgi:hypothetical protein
MEQLAGGEIRACEYRAATTARTANVSFQNKKKTAILRVMHKHIPDNHNNILSWGRLSS